MENTHFPMHGGLRLSVDGQLLIIEGEGPANVEMVKNYQASVPQFREAIMHKPWASLVLLRGTPLVSPEAKAILEETIGQAKQLRLTATAVVFVEVEYAEAIRSFWESIYQKVGLAYQFFEDEALAREWLLEQLEKR